MITIKSQQEIEIMQIGGRILAEILNQVAKEVKPGVTTAELNELAEKLIQKAGAIPAFKNFQNFPAALCTSVNEEIVHAAPSERKLKEGDIIGLDLGILYPSSASLSGTTEGKPSERCSICPSAGHCGGVRGLFTDAAVTVAVGKISAEAEKLIKVAEKALEIGLEQVRPGNYLGDIGHMVQKHVESEGFSVIRDLVGHGVGRELHEDPEIPNFGQPGTGIELKEGMTLAIEPMVAAGQSQVERVKGGFAYRTSDKSLAAHFEHTVVVTKDGCEILTRYK